MAFMDFLERYPIDKLYLCDTYVVDELEHFDSTNLPELRGVRMAKKILYAYAADDKKTLIDPISQQTYSTYQKTLPVGTFYYYIITPLSDLEAFNCSLCTSISLSKIKKFDKILSPKKK